MCGSSLSRHDLRALLLAAAAATIPVPAGADTWDNSTNTGAWSQPLNWADNTEPTGAEPVTFPTPVPFGQQIVNLSPGEVAGAITFDDNYTLSGAFGGTLQLTGGGGVIQVNNSAVATISSPISGSVGLRHSGTGGLNLSGANTFTGTVTAASTGGLSVGSDSALGNADNTLLFDIGGKLNVTNSFTTSRLIAMSPLFGGQLQVNPLRTFTVNSAFGGANAAPFTFGGTGTTILNAASARSGTSTLQNCVVRINHGAALGTGTAVVVDLGTLELGINVSSSTPIDLRHNGTVRSFQTATHTGTITVANGPQNVNLSAGGTLIISNYAGGAPAGGGGAANTHITGAGTVEMAGANSYSGNWYVDSGTLRLQNASGLGSGTSNVVVGNGATLEIFDGTMARGMSLLSGGRLSAAVPVNGQVLVAPTGTVTIHALGQGYFLTLGNSPNDLTGGGPSSMINLTGASATSGINLTQPSDYVGTWKLNQNVTLWVSGDDRLGAATNGIIFNSGMLRAQGNLGNATRNVTLSGHGIVDTFGSDVTLGDVQGSGGFTKVNPGTLIVNHVRTSGMLEVAGGTTRIAANGTASGTSKVGSLAFFHPAGPGSKLDLTNNKMIVASGFVGTPGSEGFYNGLTGEIQSGYNGGTWDGHGIITSMPEAQSGLASLGIATADQTGYAGGTFGGVSVVANDLLIMYTYGGDANLDGKINIDDYGRIDGNVASSGSVFGWFNGDFNYDGKINIDDYGIIDGNINQGAPLSSAAALEGLAAVPEPGTLALLATAGLLPLRRRRRTRCG